jgi:hypothetical protein
MRFLGLSRWYAMAAVSSVALASCLFLDNDWQPCEPTCSGLCVACEPEKTGQQGGTCAPVKAGTDPDDECEGQGVCNGDGACEAPKDSP